MSAPICPLCGFPDYSAWGDMPCACSYQDDPRGPEQEGPTIEDYCGPEHAYWCDEPGAPEAEAGTCYCGSVRYPGGPVNNGDSDAHNREGEG